STDDSISTILHLALSRLDNKDTYIKKLFIDFSSAFNTIIPQQLIGKLSLLRLNTSLCNWVLDYLTERPQLVRIGNNISIPEHQHPFGLLRCAESEFSQFQSGRVEEVFTSLMACG
ncbi:hypothetical protein NFI96_034096, partial [Prochilodus magdalenae]